MRVLLYLSSLCPAVDTDNLFLSRNCRIQIEIWLRDRISHNPIYSSFNYPICLEFKLTEDSCREVLKAATCNACVWGWMDMCHDHRGLETDHYRCPFCFPFFGGGWESLLWRLSLRGYRFPRTLKEESRLSRFGLRLIALASVLIF